MAAPRHSGWNFCQLASSPCSGLAGPGHGGHGGHGQGQVAWKPGLGGLQSSPSAQGGCWQRDGPGLGQSDLHGGMLAEIEGLVLAVTSAGARPWVTQDAGRPVEAAIATAVGVAALVLHSPCASANLHISTRMSQPSTACVLAHRTRARTGSDVKAPLPHWNMLHGTCATLAAVYHPWAHGDWGCVAVACGGAAMFGL